MGNYDKLWKWLKDNSAEKYQGGHAIHTPKKLTKDIISKIDLEHKQILTLYNVEFVISLIELGIDPEHIAFYSDHTHKSILVQKLGVNKVMTDLKDSKKFDVVLGNPPFQKVAGKSKVGIGTTLIKQFYDDLVKDGGILAMVSNTNFLGGGQKGLGYLFSENEVIDIQLNHKHHFPKIGVDIGSFIIKKTKPSSTVIKVENNGSKMNIDTSLYQYEGKKGYIPRNVNANTLPILSKILSYNEKIFDFRASNNKEAKYKVGFWAGANTGIHARYLKITRDTSFTDKNIDHPCSLDKDYPDDNLKAVFAGKLFHFVITMINGNQSDRRPANLSFFPKVDLDVKWTFDTLSKEFGLTEKEKNIVLDWANTTRKNVEWHD